MDTWNGIVYTWILNGILSTQKGLQYGEAMTKAEDLTNILFAALKKNPEILCAHQGGHLWGDDQLGMYSVANECLRCGKFEIDD